METGETVVEQENAGEETVLRLRKQLCNIGEKMPEGHMQVHVGFIFNLWFFVDILRFPQYCCTDSEEDIFKADKTMAEV